MRPELSKAHLGQEDRDLAYEKSVQLQQQILKIAIKTREQMCVEATDLYKKAGGELHGSIRDQVQLVLNTSIQAVREQANLFDQIKTFGEADGKRLSFQEVIVELNKGSSVLEASSKEANKHIV